MDTTEIPILQFVPEKYRGTLILAILLFPYLTRAYYAIYSGGGIVGAIRGILWGTNAAKPKNVDAPSPQPPSALLWLLAALIGIGTSACITPNRIAPGADPIVVQAEQFSKESTKNLDAFIKWVDRNPVLGSDLKSARELAATSGPVYINQLDAAIRTYKGSRTPDNANAVQARIDALQGLIGLIREHYTPKNP